MQLIIVVETNVLEQLNCVYVNEILNYYFFNDMKKIAIKKFVYLRKNENLQSKKKEIELLIRRWYVSNNGKSKVICFLDRNNFDIDEIQYNKFLQLKEFCDENNYYVAWFVKSIEEVLTGEKVGEEEKIKRAKQFKAKKEIQNADIKKLRRVNPTSYKTSDVINILEDLFNSI